MTDKNFECYLKRIIREKFSETGQVGLNFLLRTPTRSKVQIFKGLLSLIRQGQLEAIFKKWNGEEVIFRFTPPHPKKESNTHKEIKDCLVAVRLCALLFPIKDIPSFLRLTESQFTSLALLQFLEKSKASFEDLHFLSCYCTAFFSGELPYSMLDLGLPPQEILGVLEKVYQNTFLPHQQQLITLSKDKGNITLEGVPNERMVKLLQNEPIEVRQTSKRIPQGLYWELHPQDLPEVALSYNTQVATFFDLFCGMLASTQNQNPSLKLLLYGPPGTGKTEFAYQVAKTCRVEIMQLNFSEIQSKWVGETEKNIAKIFEAYEKKRLQHSSPVILLLNEADGLMSRRVEVNHSNDAFHNQVQTKMLEELDHFEGVLIATTNVKQHLDTAFFRRFSFCQEISLPDYQVRERLLSDSIKRGNLPEAMKAFMLPLAWSPAQLRNVEQKIRQFAAIKPLHSELLHWVLAQEGIVNQGTGLGFVQKKVEKIVTKSGDQVLYH
jgi:DNA polymerase III delta prime subunit